MGEMRFGVLGPVELRTGEGLVGLGPPMQRAVLACLLLHANRAVGVDEIIDQLWADRPPRTARKSIQVYVWRLRQLVGERLASTPPGYRITVDPQELDLTRLDSLMGSARAAVGAGDPAAAVELYRSAAELWRGPAIADLLGIGRFAASATRLDRIRLRLHEERIDAELAMDRHAEVLPLLEELVSRHPLHERFAEQQVLSLHRAGRRGEAVEAYLRCRRALADELGLEPGPVLRRLADLARMPGGAAEPAGSVAVGLRELPQAVSVLVGRDRELAALCDSVIARQGAAVGVHIVTGAGGVGKSALAVRAAHQLAAVFPDGQLYADLHGATAGLRPVPPIAILGRFLRALGVADEAVPTDEAEAAARLRSLLADRRLLMVLDNAHDAHQVRPLIPAGVHCAVLVTSRRGLADLDGAEHLELGTLTDAAATELLHRLAGGDRVAGAGSTADLLRWLGGLPLAIRIAGARLAARPRWTLADLAGRLGDERHRLRELRLGDIAVRTSFLVSYQHLTDPLAARLFRLIGTVDGPHLTPQTAAVLLDVAPAQAGQALEELVDARLLDESAPARYRMHDLIRLFAREQAEEEPVAARDGAIARLLDDYLDLTRHALGMLRPGTRAVPGTGRPRFATADAALDWLESERANLVAATVQAAASPAHARRGIDLADSLYLFFEMRGHIEDWLVVDAAGVDAAARLGDRAAEARLLHDLAVACFYLHRTDSAAEHLHRSLAVSRAAGDVEGQARALNQFGILHGTTGDYDRAADSLQESLVLRRRLGDLRSCAATEGNIGMAYRLAGRYAESIRSSRAAARLARRSAAPEIEANALGNLGEVHLLLGRHDHALSYLRRALAVTGLPPNERQRGSTMGTLAEAYLGAGRIGAAIAHAELSVDAFRRADFRHGEALALRRLGLMLRDHGDPGRGADQLRLALGILTALGSGDAETVRADLRPSVPAAEVSR